MSKNSNEINRSREFRFKYVSKHFESIPTKKNFDKKCLTISFSLHLGQKLLKSQKEICNEKIFDLEVFVLKYVMKHSKSIPTTKKFDQKFWTLPFFTIFAKK